MQNSQPLYPAANDGTLAAPSVSIFADRAWLREALADDATAGGFQLRDCGELARLADPSLNLLGDLVLVDCPQVGMVEAAALTRLDERARRAGAQLIVSTSLDALDAVFACCDQSSPQILVEPSHGERVIALGRALALGAPDRVRELADDDRLTLLRLTEQIGRIAERLENFSRGGEEGARAFRFESPGLAFRGAPTESHSGALDSQRPPLPDPRLVRRIIRQRQMRARFFDSELFADPAWDMLLDLTAARAEHARVSVTSLCIASGVPPTTALRWIGQMTGVGLFERVEDDIDRRRAFVALSDAAADGMARYFAEVGHTAMHLV